MKLDFSAVEDFESFVSIPEGTYVCRVAEVRATTTREQAVRWALRLEVVEGDYAGRTAAWDGLVFSERGLPRVKHVLSVLGFDVSGTLDLEPQDLNDARARVQLVIEDHTDKLTGIHRRRLRVPYAGYEPLQRGLEFPAA
jgi:hypothetical protein